MRVVTRRTLKEFWEKYPAAEKPLREWEARMHFGRFANASEIVAAFSDADVIGDKRIVFNIGGNKFRLVARVNYSAQAAYVRFVGTHNQYNNIDAAEV